MRKVERERQRKQRQQHGERLHACRWADTECSHMLLMRNNMFSLVNTKLHCGSNVFFMSLTIKARQPTEKKSS